MGVNDIGNNIRRYMKIKGISISELAKTSGMGTATISNILNGKSEPKSSTLLNIINALGITIENALSDAPKLEMVRFRTDKMLSAREKAERDQTLANTAIWLNDYNELEALTGDFLYYKSLYEGKENNPVKAATAARKALDIDNLEEPVCNIACLIEKAGIKLRIYDFGFKKTYGLSVSASEKGPAIIVNSADEITIERQIFTIAHELGHILLHPNSYNEASDERENIEEENEANMFAGYFLLPDEALRNAWNESKGLYFVDAILKIKKIYRVSYQTVLVRLLQLSGSGKEAYKTLLNNFKNEYKNIYNVELRDKNEPDPLMNLVAGDEPDELSPHDLAEDRFEKLVRLAYDNKEISISRAGEMLNKSIIEMRKLVGSWKGNKLNV